MTSPRRGFKKWVLQAIRDMPGHTSDEYARIYLDQNPDGSNARKVDPVYSLKTTLNKEFREGRMPGIKKDNGRYYPAGFIEGETPSRNGRPVQIMLPPDAAKRVDDLVESGGFSSPSEAIIWLVQEGIKARREDKLDPIANEIEEIRRRKESVRNLLFN